MWGLGSLLKRWDATSLSTYMWHMIEQDVLSRYRPGRGTLRLIVITDGRTCSRRLPTEASAEWIQCRRRCSTRDTTSSGTSSSVRGGETRTPLAGATSGSYVQIDQFHRDHPDVRNLLAAIAGNADTSARHSRQQQYQLERTG